MRSGAHWACTTQRLFSGVDVHASTPIPAAITPTTASSILRPSNGPGLQLQEPAPIQYAETAGPDVRSDYHEVGARVGDASSRQVWALVSCNPLLGSVLDYSKAARRGLRISMRSAATSCCATMPVATAAIAAK